MKIVLFQIYGDQRAYHLELTYSVLSVYRFLKEDPADIRLVLLSEEHNQRPDLPVEPLLISSDTLREWQMDGTYNHAVKICGLHYALRHFEAPVILIDSDTIIKEHPKKMFERIGPAKTLMHACEGPLRASLEWSEWQALIERAQGRVAAHSITSQSVMYNSGVLGLDPSDAPFLEMTQEVMLDIRARCDIFTAEQLAASLVFHAHSRELSTCEDLVEHYWSGPRAYYHFQMRQMFPDVLNGGGIPKSDMAPFPLRQTPPVALRHRLIARLKRLQRRAGPEYAASYLAYRSALSLKDFEPQMANVWATEALGMLKWGMKGQTIWPEDFKQFSSAGLPRQEWMQPQLRKGWEDYWRRAIVCKESNASQ